MFLGQSNGLMKLWTFQIPTKTITIQDQSVDTFIGLIGDFERSFEMLLAHEPISNSSPFIINHLRVYWSESLDKSLVFLFVSTWIIRTSSDCCLIEMLSKHFSTSFLAPNKFKSFMETAFKNSTFSLYVLACFVPPAYGVRISSLHFSSSFFLWLLGN